MAKWLWKEPSPRLCTHPAEQRESPKALGNRVQPKDKVRLRELGTRDRPQVGVGW